MVLNDPEGISPSELHTFSAIYPHNARPTQAANGRSVKESVVRAEGELLICTHAPRCRRQSDRPSLWA